MVTGRYASVVALDILVALIERAGQTVGKDELIARAWPDTTVEEASLRVHICALRKTLGDGRTGNRYIVNVPGRGYRFVAPATRERVEQAAFVPSKVAQRSIFRLRGPVLSGATRPYRP